MLPIFCPLCCHGDRDVAVEAAEDDLDAFDDGREEADLSVHFQVHCTHSYLFMKKIIDQSNSSCIGL